MLFSRKNVSVNLRDLRWELAVLAAILLAVLAGFAGNLMREATAGGTLYYDRNPAPSGDSATYSIRTKWDRNTLTYSTRNCPRSLDCAIAQQAIREAVEPWDAFSGITLNEVSGEADINIAFYSGMHGDPIPFDGPAGLLGNAFFPLSWLGGLGGDVHLDNDETWVAWQPGNSLEVHLQTVAMHEVGHALGLEHSGDPASLMWYEYVGVRGIGPDDIAGIQSLYGLPNSTDAAPAPSGDGAAPSGVSATATTTLKMRSGPGTSFAQVGKVPYKATVPILGKNTAGDWLYVDYNGVRGWVAAWYCKLDESLDLIPVIGQTPNPTPATPPGQSPVPTSVTATTSSNTRIRSGPGTNYAQVGTIDWGATVPVLAKNPAGDWLYIEFAGQRGWIAAWLVKINGDISTLPVQNQ